MFFLMIFFWSKIWATPQATLDILSKLFPEQSQSYLQERIDAAENPFELWRAFPGYFYYLARRSNIDQKEIGFCLGDAHFENFGIIGLDQPIFTLNDLDDVSFCPLNLDLMRLYLSHKFVSEISDKEFFDAYELGLQKKMDPIPNYILNEKEKSKEKGRDLPKKIRKIYDAKICSGEFEKIDSSEEMSLKNLVDSYSFGCKRLKLKGGSGGNERYILFYFENNKPRAIELKKLAMPASLREVGIDQNGREKIIKDGINFFFGTSASSFYSVLKFNDALYLKRPLWASHRNLKIDELEQSDLKHVALFEVKIMGYFHSFSRKSFNPPVDWRAQADQIWSKWTLSF